MKKVFGVGILSLLIIGSGLFLTRSTDKSDFSASERAEFGESCPKFEQQTYTITFADTEEIASIQQFAKSISVSNPALNNVTVLNSQEIRDELYTEYPEFVTENDIGMNYRPEVRFGITDIRNFDEIFFESEIERLSSDLGVTVVNDGVYLIEDIKRTVTTFCA